MRLLAVLCSLVAVVSSGRTADGKVVQRPDAGLIRWAAQIPGAEILPQGRSYRLFEEIPAISIDWTLFNESGSPFVFDFREFCAGVQARLSASAAIPVRVEWDATVRSSVDRIVTPAAPADVIRVEPSTGVGMVMRVIRADQEAFSAGTYEILLSINNALAVIRDGEGQPWRGRALNGTTLHLTIAPPTTPRDRAMVHRLQGSSALADRRYAEAADSFARAIAADPSDQTLWGGLGMAYLFQDRYREAIDAFERALPTLRNVHSGVPRMLAMAYLGTGDETNARRVLTAQGKPESRVSEEIRTLREVLQKRRKR